MRVRFPLSLSGNRSPLLVPIEVGGGVPDFSFGNVVGDIGLHGIIGLFG
jgi:hypothetical protein